MGNGERAIWIVAYLMLIALVVLSHDGRREPAAAGARPRSEPGVRMSMAALHQQGGVPLGWQPTMPPGDVAAGRAAFERLGCPACHRVAGEHFANDVPTPRGPELTGMGSHHPAAYFAEAILDPDAVLIDEPGYLDDGGRSTMPTYADMTLAELSDVVAYLGSLRDGATASCHDTGSTAPPPTASVSLRRDDRPAPAPGDAQVFFAQSYDVLPGKLADLERWFATRGREGFGDAQGLVSLETFVDVAKPGGTLTTMFGFRDDAALRTFVADPAMAELWKDFDGFVGPHGHVSADGPLVYRAPALSR